MKFTLVQAPEILKDYVECFSVVERPGAEPAAIKVAPKAAPGIVFQHHNARSAIRSIVTNSVTSPPAPTLFLYGAGIEPSVMNFEAGPYSSTQVVLKPHALNSLFGMNALALSNGLMEAHEFSAGSLHDQLLNANDAQGRICLLADFLIAQLKRGRARDALVEESLRLIDQNVARISVKHLLERLNISERQFQRRFAQTVGISPQSYIRVQRFNEAIRLIKAGRFARLTDIAYALNFYDQSHLIRDVTAFSGVTPKNVSQRQDDFYHDQVGYSYL